MLTAREMDLLANVQNGKNIPVCTADVRSLAARIILSRSICQEAENTVATFHDRQPRKVGLFFHQTRKVCIVETLGPLSEEERQVMRPSDDVDVSLQQRVEQILDELHAFALLRDPINGEAEMDAFLDNQETFDAAIRDAAAKKGIDLDAMIAKIPLDIRKDIQKEYEEDPELQYLLKK